MRIDLHCHTTASDGVLSPEALVRRAAERDVELLAVTDHDTLNGIFEARAAARILNVRLLAGVEISTIWRGKEIHVVGIAVDEHDKGLLGTLAEQQDRRLARSMAIAKRLECLGFEGAWAGAVKRAENAVPGRAHIAKFLVDSGSVRSAQGAFDHLLTAGRPAYVPADWMSLTTAVECITRAGGRAVLAHPERYGLGCQQLQSLISEFAEIGGWGLENSAAREPKLSRCIDLPNKTSGLVRTWGSDFHSPMASIELGVDVKDPVGLEADLLRLG